VNEPFSFAFDSDIAIWRHSGKMSLDRAIGFITEAIVAARERGIRKLLVDTTGLDGFDPPSLASRHQIVRAWAGASGGAVQLAVLVRPEMSDPERFGVVAAGNFGVEGDEFMSEGDALAWLRSR
jgi:hypothetical protein